MIEVVNKRTHKPTSADIYIGRGSVLGNPFTGSKILANTKAQFQCESREEAIALYRNWLNDHIQNRTPEIVNELNKIYLKVLKEQVNLVCYCAPYPCHGEIIEDFILKAINERFVIIDLDLDLRIYYKRFYARINEAKPVLLTQGNKHFVMKTPELAQEQLRISYEETFNRGSLWNQKAYGGDPEKSGLPW